MMPCSRKINLRYCLSLVFLGLIGIPGWSQINITPGVNATTLVNAFMGAGMTASNVTINCNAQSYGTFSNGNTTNLGITNGILLTTGQAQQAAAMGGSSSGNDASICVGTLSSDPQLTSLDPTATNDACIIEFDVVPMCNNLTIRFVFGSEEYPEYVGSINDVFGFFVTGPNPAGGTYNNFNLAQLPNGTTVTINNVNATTNSTFYVSNGGTTIEYDGMTTVISSTMDLTCGQSYHFKLAIADASDCIVDSGVFIDFISCTVPPFTVSTSQTPESCGSANGTATATVTGGVGPFSFSWSPGGQTTATATGLTAGTYTVSVTDLGSSCSTPQTATVTVGSTGTAPNITVTPTAQTICNGGNVILTASGGTSYTWSPTTGLSASTGATVTASPTTTTTYTVTGTGSCGTGTATSTITVNPIPTTTAGSNSPICAGATLNLTASASGVTGTTYSWTGPNGFTSTQQNPSIPSATAAASGTYTVTVAANGCSSASTVNVTVNPVPTTTAGSNSPICAGATLNLTATASGVAGSTYSWTGPGGFTSTQQNPTRPSALTTYSGTYTVTVTANGCSSTSTVNVTVNPIPVANAGADQAICIGGSANLNGSGGGTYSWSPATGLSSTTIANPLASPTVNTTYTLTVTQNGCSSTDQVVVSVNSVFDATITPVAALCADASPITLSAVDAGGTWSGTGITNAANGTFDPAVAGAGTHTITYTIPGSCGDTDTEVITVNAIPTTTAGSNSPICEGSTLNLTATTATGASYSWTGPNGFNSTNQNPSITNATMAANGSYSVTVTANGCSSTTTVDAIINAIPSTTAGSNSPICEGTDLNLTATSVTGASYSWTGPNGFTSSLQNPSVASATTAASGTYMVTITLNGCSSTSTVTTTINPNADATINPAGPFCDTDAATTITAIQAGGTWTGNGITNQTTGAFDPAIAGTGTHTITYSIGGACGDAQTTTIVVSQQMDATITPAGPFCESNPAINLVAVDVGGNWSGTGITNASTGNFNPAVAGPGTHTITYSVGSGQCADTQTTTIQVIADADATINAAGPFCILDAPFTMTAADAGGTWSGTGITNAANGTFDPAIAGAGIHTITYTISGVCGDVQSINVEVVSQVNTTITQVGPFCIDAGSLNLTAATAGGIWSGNGITNSSAGTFNPAVAGPGTHTITYTIGGNCGNSSTIDIVVNPLPVVSFTGNISGCTPVNAQIVNTTANTTSGTWLVDGSPFSTDPNGFTNTFIVPGCYDITFIATDNNGCSSQNTVQDMVCVYAIPQADFTWSPTDATVLNPVIQFNNTSVGASSYVWTFNGTDNSTSTNPSYTFPSVEGGTYDVCLTAASANGCLDSTCQFITIYDEFLIYVPNAFTVDGDGVNDIFRPVISGHDPESYEFYIFNRWGELIFKSDSEQNGWDGYYKGQIAKQDVYVWKLKVKRLNDGEKKQYIGHVTLLR